MKNKTLVQLAEEAVPWFAQSYKKFRIRMLVEQKKSAKTIEEYGRQVSTLSLHFKTLPEHLTGDQIDYLAGKIGKEGSNSMFKHVVFGLRVYFKSMGVEREQHRLPSL
jgi:hypothetical protein